jgi:hypothetical protein
MSNDLQFYQSGVWTTPSEISVYDGTSFANCSNVYIRTEGVWAQVWPPGATTPTGQIPKFKPDYVLTGRPAGATYDEIWLANLQTSTWAQFNFTTTFASTNRIWPVNGSYPNYYPFASETGIIFVGEKVGGDGSLIHYGNIQSNVVTGGGNIAMIEQSQNNVTSDPIRDIFIRPQYGNVNVGRLQGVGAGGLLFYANAYLPNSFANTNWSGTVVSTGITSDLNGIDEYYAVGQGGYVFVDTPFLLSKGGSPVDINGNAITGTSTWAKLNPTGTTANLNTVCQLDNTFVTTGGQGGQLGIVGYGTVGSFTVWDHQRVTGYDYYSSGYQYTYSYVLNFTKTINKIKYIDGGASIYYPFGYDPFYYIQYLNGMAVGDQGEVLVYSKPPEDPRGTGWDVNNPNYVWWKPSSYPGGGTGTNYNLRDLAQKIRGSGLDATLEVVAVGENDTIIRSNSFGYTWDPVSSAPTGYNWSAIENFDGGTSR